MQLLQLLVSLISGFGQFVVYAAIVCGAGFALLYMTGETIGELSRFGTRPFWDRHLHKFIWPAAFAGAGWAWYSLYNLTFIPAVFSVLGLLLLAFVSAFIVVATVNSRRYERPLY